MTLEPPLTHALICVPYGPSDAIRSVRLRLVSPFVFRPPFRCTPRHQRDDFLSGLVALSCVQICTSRNADPKLHFCDEIIFTLFSPPCAVFLCFFFLRDMACICQYRHSRLNIPRRDVIFPKVFKF